MSSAIFQLQTYNSQDIYLTQRPETTYFLVKYKRYTQFAMESIPVDFSTRPEWGKTATAVIPYAGDLLYKVYLVVDLPEISSKGSGYIGRWTDKVGYALTKSIQISVGGNIIDTHYSPFLMMYSELTTDESHIDGLNSLIGNVDECTGKYYFRRPSYRLHIPLQFWFCQSPALALPVIAMRNSNINITVDFRKFSEIWINCFQTETENIFTDDNFSSTRELNAFLLCDYIWLTKQEQTIFTTQPIEYVITQTQTIKDINITNINANSSANNQLNYNLSTNNIPIRFSHPVKCLLWCFQKETHISEPTEANRWIGNQWNNFSVTTFSPNDIGFTNNKAQSFIPSWKTVLEDIEIENQGSVQVLQSEILNWSSFDFAQDGPMETCQITLNELATTPLQNGDYYNKLQTYNYFNRIPSSPGVYCYSFALNASEQKPCGTLNFSNLNRVNLKFTLKPKIENSKCLYPESLTTHLGQQKNIIEFTKPTDSVNNIFTSYLVKNTGQFISPLTDTENLQTSYLLNIYAINYNIFRVANSIGNVGYVN